MQSKLPIDQQVSWLSSKAAGTLKAHAMTEHESDFWQVILNVTNHISKLEKKIEKHGELEKRVDELSQKVTSLENQALDNTNFKIGKIGGD